MHWLLVAGSYLCGSVPFGVLVTALVARKDVRAEGSGNIGATNVARVAGKKVGALVLVLDALKGAVPVWGALYWAPNLLSLHVAVAVAAFVGHVFPVWLKFKGGKGVATALGVLVVLIPWAALIGFFTWVVVIAITRLSSAGSLLGAVLAIVASFILPGPLAYSWLSVGLLVAMLWTHRGNLARLRSRAERKV